MTKHLSSQIRYALFATFALGVAACGVADPSESPSTEPATFTRTIVHIQADGTETVEQTTITAAQQRAEQDARGRILGGEPSTRAGESDVVTRDPGCAASSMWMFDQADLKEGNEICFFGSGYVNLANYCRTSNPMMVCPGTWSKAVRSYWAGTDSGLFSINNSPTCGSGGCFESFSPFQKALTVSSCGQISQYLGLQELCTPA
jgi:hypothetical protein